MQEEFRILILDQNNIGYDLDYSPLMAHGHLEKRDTFPADDVTSHLSTLSPQIVIVNRPIFSPEILKRAANQGLRLICLTATGTNTVNLDSAREHGIAVCNIVGYSTNSVAQHTFALALELINQTAILDGLAKTWHQRAESSPDRPPAWSDLSSNIHELAGKTWGIIGLGAIGRRVATIAEAFGCRVVWASASQLHRTEPWPQLSLEQLLQTSDIVSIHSPINDASRNLINKQGLEIMKRNAILINVGRGGVVNEADLAAALNTGTIAGAGIDVLWPEPPAADNPLLSIDNPNRLILTPHVAWAAVEARQRAIEECALNIIAWKQGIRRNRVD